MLDGSYDDKRPFFETESWFWPGVKGKRMFGTTRHGSCQHTVQIGVRRTSCIFHMAKMRKEQDTGIYQSHPANK